MSEQLSMMPTPSNEAERRRVLHRHKVAVTSLLALMAVIFIACSWAQSRGNGAAWIGYVRAAAEAGMVGGLADWFAVTALFKYPMGIPIPHTAIIPNKKDQVAGVLSDFVSENFLNARTITDKVMAAGIPERVGRWLAQPENAGRVSEEAGKFTVRMVEGIDPAEAEGFINTQLIDRLAEPIWAPPLGRTLEGLIADGKVEPVVDDIVVWARRKVDGMEGTVVTMIDERMPRWAPRFAKELVGQRVYDEMVAFMEDVDTDEQHEARRAIRRQITQFAQDLQFDGDMISRVEALKNDVMGSAAVTSAAGGIWEQLSEALVAQASDAESALRRKAAASAREWGQKLVDDPSVRADAERTLEKITHFAAENGADQIVGIIAETIERWDGEEAADKIELMVGKDLQFIRLNGTIVGALAGLAIYTVSQLLFY
ncbi:DUF445 family protein [Corynebacterium sp. zg912]|uniref:DUF445 family protein n=1 Tax=Corynebacterium wankanglinii TaxID=2735136 RepID=A0A7H0KAK4_9CORY|nr:MULTISPECIES: DUF445 family protein [Corynebacterium]MBA1836340.1 DUF445 family protein [Corynebacterium wankanglinii]MCR5928335.1 DUF445 family protein [Corynebacterium sp. zg912]QNP94320.1 DUF445 family protein [Corynebacterium wankanglinii]